MRSATTASISALNDTCILRINETQMEQAPDSVQARFNKVFLKTLVERLEKASDVLTSHGESADGGVGEPARTAMGPGASSARLS